MALTATMAIGPTVAFADPPRPTDYRSEIVSITPEVDGVTARIVGGDAFIELAAPGKAVTIGGYQGEPYLRFDVDGSIWENRRSPAHYLNQDRYSQTEVPPEASVDAEPDWHRVGSGGSYTWHDHRTHWMQTTPPFGLGPGDEILDTVIPITVDGQPVEVRVRSVWMPAPSNVPWVIAAAVAALMGLALVQVARSRPRLVVIVAVALSAVALVIGAWQTWSLPSETGPPPAHWALPLSATVLALVGAAWPRWSVFALRALALVAAVQLLVWAVVRRDVLDHAILPTDAPFWLDRAVTAGVGVLAAVCALVSVTAIVRLMQPVAAQPD
ncbi:MAG: hypothetical protein U0Q03_19950 [Acidimicrobiales bacterium]